MVTSLRAISAVTSALAGFALTGLISLGGVFAPAAAPDIDPGDVDRAFASTCIGYCQHPTNAAKVFRWGREAWREEFEEGELGENWTSDRPALIGQQNGMLTIRAFENTGSIRVWPTDQAASYGRWESRVRAVELGSGGATYRFFWELVPVEEDHCGASGIVLASYQPGDEQVTGAVRTLPNHEFSYARTLDLRSRAWHSYAVEVTPKRISWFVDTQVIHSERRPEALSGVRLRPQFRLVGEDGQTMNRSWMQMDWARYYTLERPNAQPVKAPRMTRGTYTGAC